MINKTTASKLLHQRFIIFFVIVLPLGLPLSGCLEKDVTYFPLQEGKNWLYQVTTKDMDMTHNYKQLVTNVTPRTVDGKRVFTRNVNDGVLYFYEKANDGVRRIGLKRHTDINTLYEKQEHFVFRLPLKTGVSWEQETVTGVLAVVMDPFRRHYKLRTPVKMQYTVMSIDAVKEVSAGKFTRCAEVTGTGKTRVQADKALGTLNITVQSTDWYCPGVGLVQSDRTETTDSNILKGGEFSLELLSYSVD